MEASGYTFKHSPDREFYIPSRMMPGIKRYIEERILPGDFLRAVICNNLKEAVMYADGENISNLPAYASYFYSHTPIACWGSEEKMKAWINDDSDDDNH